MFSVQKAADLNYLVQGGQLYCASSPSVSLPCFASLLNKLECFSCGHSYSDVKLGAGQLRRRVSIDHKPLGLGNFCAMLTNTLAYYTWVS
jgi:hypothetical protein